MAQVGLFKKVGTYTDKEGREKQYINFYLRCGDALIPVEPKFFANEEGHDYQFNGRKAVMSAMAEVLPEKSDSGKKKTEKPQGTKKPALQSFDDNSDIPF